jgi:hypothetical protein
VVCGSRLHVPPVRITSGSGHDAGDPSPAPFPAPASKSSPASRCVLGAVLAHPADFKKRSAASGVSHVRRNECIAAGPQRNRRAGITFRIFASGQDPIPDAEIAPRDTPWHSTDWVPPFRTVVPPLQIAGLLQRPRRRGVVSDRGRAVGVGGRKIAPTSVVSPALLVT